MVKGGGPTEDTLQRLVLKLTNIAEVAKLAQSYLYIAILHINTITYTAFTLGSVFLANKR